MKCISVVGERGVTSMREDELQEGKTKKMSCKFLRILSKG